MSTAFQQSAWAASGPPAEAGPHPADEQAAIHLVVFVRERRSRRVSWQNLSKMTGVSESLLRRVFGGDQ